VDDAFPESGLISLYLGGATLIPALNSYVFVDDTGDETREIQQGRCYEFGLANSERFIETEYSLPNDFIIEFDTIIPDSESTVERDFFGNFNQSPLGGCTAGLATSGGTRYIFFYTKGDSNIRVDAPAYFNKLINIKIVKRGDVKEIWINGSLVDTGECSEDLEAENFLHIGCRNTLEDETPERCTESKIGNFIIKDLDNNILQRYLMDEQKGTDCFSSVVEWEEEKLVNVGFEEDLDSWIGTGAYREINTDIVRDGSKSLRLERWATVASLLSQSLSLTPGSQVIFSAWIYPTYNTEIYMYLDGHVTPNYFLSETLEANQWNYIESDILFIQNASTKFTLRDTGGNSGELLYIDNVSTKQIHSPINGIIQNAVTTGEPGGFHAIDDRFASKQNEVGHSEYVSGIVNLSTSLEECAQQNIIEFDFIKISSGIIIIADGSVYRHISIHDYKVTVRTSGDPFNFYYNFNLYQKYSIKIVANGRSRSAYVNGSLVGSITSNNSLQFRCTRFMPEEGVLLLNFKVIENGEISHYFDLSKRSNDNIGGIIADYSLTNIIYTPLQIDQTGSLTGTDIFGNSPTYSGRVKYNLGLINAGVGKFNGVAKAVPDEYINLGTKHTLEIRMFVDETVDNYILFGNGGAQTYLQLANDEYISYRANNSNVQSFIMPKITEAGIIKIKLIRSDLLVNLFINGVESTTGTKILNVNNDFEFRQVSGYAGYEIEGGVSYIKMTNDETNKAYHWPFQIGAGGIVPDVEPRVIEDHYNARDNNFADIVMGDPGSTTYIRTINSNGVTFTPEGEQLISNRPRININNLSIGRKNRITVSGIGIIGAYYSDDTSAVSVNHDLSVEPYVLELDNVTDDPVFYIYFKGKLTDGQPIITVSDIKIEQIFDPIDLTLTDAELDPTSDDYFWQKDSTGIVENYPLNKGFSQGLLCHSSGSTSIPIKDGRLEFEFFYAGNSLSAGIFILSSPDTSSGFGYEVWLSSTGMIRILRIDDGNWWSIRMSTVEGYFDPTKKYGFKFTRETNGELALYIRGNEFGDSFMLAEASSGENPRIDTANTDLAFLVLDLDAGQIISNLYYNNTVLEVDDLTEGTGAYLKQFILARDDNSGLDTNGLPLTNPAGDWYNLGKERCIQMPPCPELLAMDTKRKFFGVNMVADPKFLDPTKWNIDVHPNTKFLATGGVRIDAVGSLTELTKQSVSGFNKGDSFIVVVKVENYIRGEGAVRLGSSGNTIYGLASNGVFVFEKTIGYDGPYSTGITCKIGGFSGDVTYLSIKRKDDETPIPFGAEELPYNYNNQIFCNAEKNKIRDIGIYEDGNMSLKDLQIWEKKVGCTFWVTLETEFTEALLLE